MNLILSFIGKLPDYIVDCIYQIRLFYKGDIYLILDDYKSMHLNEINKHNIKFITYDTVNNNSSKILMQYANKFAIMDNLNDRKFLFFRAFERMFLANELINIHNLTDNIFMEIDNLIYDNPEKWINEFSKKELAYMFNEAETCSSGIMYIKNKNSMQPLLNSMIEFIKNITNYWVSEMGALYDFYKSNQNYIYIMPSLYNDTKNDVDNRIYENYKNTIFDPASYGQYLLGLDTVHTNGNIVKGTSFDHHKIVCKRYKIDWQTKEDDGLKKPYIFNENTNEWILINNLHVHSKDLKSGLSI